MPSVVADMDEAGNPSPPQKDACFIPNAQGRLQAAAPPAGCVLRLQAAPGVELRLLATADAPALYALVDANRAHLARWLPWAAGETLADAEAFVHDGIRRFYAGDGFELAIEHEGRLVGVIGLHAIHPVNRRTSIGYWLAEGAQGKGIARAAVRALVAHCFDDLKLHRVDIRVAPENARSLAVPRALGFREEGTLRGYERMGDGWLDLTVFSMLEDEWRAR